MRRPALLLALLLSACGSGTTTYVGTVAGTDVAVGMVTDGTHVALFFCGGATSFATSTKWFRFTASGQSLSATKDTWTASGTIAGSSASGSVDRGDGISLSWSATEVDDGSVVGLYESVTSAGTAGVVVQSPTTAQGAFIESTLAVEQIIPIMPFDVQAQGLDVTIAGNQMFIPRATP